MSLPFADSPDKSSIYNDLKVKKLVDLTADDFDAFRTRMDAQGVEGLEDEYRRLLLLGLASNKISLSGAIPGTNEIIESAVASGAGYTTIHTPKLGEVWQFVAGCANTTTNPTGSVTTELDIYDSVNDRRVLFLDQASTSSSDYPLGETNFPPLVYSYPNVLRQRVEGTFDLATRTYSIIRIR